MEWEPVLLFSLPQDQPGQALHLLDRRLRELGIEASRFQCGTVQALVIPIQRLEEASRRNDGGLSIQWGSKNPGGIQPVVFVSGSEDAAALAGLPSMIEGGHGYGQPAWVGVPAGPAAADPADFAASLRVDDSSGRQAVFLISPLGAKTVRGARSIAPFPTKIGEGPGNLRDRSDWFQRRTR